MANKQILKQLDELPDKIMERYEGRWEICKYLYLFDHYPFNSNQQQIEVLNDNNKRKIYGASIKSKLGIDTIPDTICKTTQN